MYANIILILPLCPALCLNRVFFTSLYHSPPLNVTTRATLLHIWHIPLGSEIASLLFSGIRGITRPVFVVLVHKGIVGSDKEDKEEIKEKRGPLYNNRVNLFSNPCHCL